jgi:DNA-binding CsgD family transcriptional regulator
MSTESLAIEEREREDGEGRERLGDDSKSRYLGLTSAQRHADRSLARRGVAETPTLAQFLAHAESHGTETVYETAEDFLPKTELIQLDVRLTEIDGKRRKRYGIVPKRKRLSKTQRLETIAFLDREGLPTSRIAKQLGIRPDSVRRLRTEARKLGLLSPSQGSEADESVAETA